MPDLVTQDPLIAAAISAEQRRQRETAVLIASENYASRAVMQANGSVLTNKYAEGYPGRRYYAGCEHVDEVEKLAIERACKLFGAEHANVQPHSGSNANLAALIATLQPGDRGMALALAHGGHLSHGSSVNVSGRYYEFAHYHVDAESGLLDYDAIARQAEEFKPKLIIAGFSAYARTVDFARFGRIAKDVGAVLLADIAHIAGLVAGGVHPTPVGHADIITTTTHKTLRGARGALALTSTDFAKKYDSALFPRLQGGPLMHTIAAKAVAFGEALQPEFKAYARGVVDNARAIADELQSTGMRIIGGGTDTHIILVDLRPIGVTGAEVTTALELAGIVVNKNMIPFDPQPPKIASGVRIGTAAITTRGMQVDDARQLGGFIIDAIAKREAPGKLEALRKTVSKFVSSFPLPGVDD